MTPSTDWAATGIPARLRAADPADAVLDDALWPSAAARATLERIVTDTGVESDGRPDARSNRRRAGQRWLLPITAALVVLVVAAAVALVHALDGPPATQRTASAPSTSASGLAGPAQCGPAQCGPAQCGPALVLARNWGSDVRLAGSRLLTGAQLVTYMQARTDTVIFAGAPLHVASASVCVVDGSLDPPLPLAPPLPPASVSPEKTYTRVSIIVADGQATLFQVGSPRDIPATVDLPGDSDAAHRQAALAAVETLVKSVPTLPGAIRRDNDPSGRLGRAAQRPGVVNVVDRAAFWTAPGTMDAAIAELRAHLPVGWTVSGTGSSGQFHGATTSESLLVDVPGADQSGVYVQSQVVFDVVPYRGGVAIRADAQAIWLPARTAAEYIPADATSVDVTVTRPGRDTVRRTLTGDAMTRLADVVNAQQVATPGVSSCPAATGALTDVLSFHTADATIQITAWRDGCLGVRVTADGAAQPALDGVDAIDAAVIEALGLPAGYRIN